MRHMWRLTCKIYVSPINDPSLYPCCILERVILSVYCTPYHTFVNDFSRYTAVFHIDRKFKMAVT
ncbi:hypothetical protein Plhal304r1_c056g0141861 [Plasmopara halstedii]